MKNMISGLLVLALTALPGCKGPGTEAPTAAPAASAAAQKTEETPTAKASKGKDTGPIKVGILHSLSGTMAISETSLKDVALMTIEALNMGSMNYAKWSEAKKQFAFNFVFANSFDDILAFARAMKEHGAKPEMECFDTGHTNSHRVLVELGLLEPPFHFSFIMGVLGGIPASARHLAFQAEQVPAGSRWKVIGISRDQWPLAMAALALGGDVRIGLEDNFYLPSGEMAKSNGELVAAAVELVRLSGRSVATVDEVRQLHWPHGGSN